VQHVGSGRALVTMHIAGTEHHVVRRPLPITGLDQFRTLAPTGGVPACLVDVLDVRSTVQDMSAPHSREISSASHCLAALAIMAGRRRRPRGHIEQLPSGSFRAKVYAGIDP
jgi:hypothetical protein